MVCECKPIVDGLEGGRKLLLSIVVGGILLARDEPISVKYLFRPLTIIVLSFTMVLFIFIMSCLTR